MPAARREYRDRLFTFIFGNEEHKEWTLSLYNAVNKTSYDDPEAITLKTLQEVLYMGMHNDVSFLLANEMNMYEQQSTYNPNMPLRMMQYASSAYERNLSERKANKYGRSLIPLPVPKLLVFYNGPDERDEEETLLLSDAFPSGSDPDIWVRVHLLNICEGENRELMNACRPLREYSWTVARIREKMKCVGTTGDRTDAIGEVIDAMPEDFVIRTYLAAHKAEVVDMLLTEYNEAETMGLFREQGREQGREEGRIDTLAENISSLVESLGCTPEHAMDLLRVPEEERPRLIVLSQER